MITREATAEGDADKALVGGLASPQRRCGLGRHIDCEHEEHTRARGGGVLPRGVTGALVGDPLGRSFDPRLHLVHPFGIANHPLALQVAVNLPQNLPNLIFCHVAPSSARIDARTAATGESTGGRWSTTMTSPPTSQA